MAKILVVEDDAHVIRLMSMWLTHSGHEVAEARDGEQAKAIIGEGPIDCVVTDVNMPGCDGLQLVEWLRHEAMLQVPVIMLSARCDQARLSDALSCLGVRVYPKPFSPSRLSAEINTAIEKSAAEAS